MVGAELTGGDEEPSNGVVASLPALGLLLMMPPLLLLLCDYTCSQLPIGLL